MKRFHTNTNTRAIKALRMRVNMFFESKKRLSQQGLSLIELLIVILLTSFLVLGITKIFAGNVISSKVAKDLGYATEGGGYGSLLLIKYLRLTGYVNYFQVSKSNSEINKVVFSNNESRDNGELDVVTIEYEAPVRTHTGTGIYKTCGGFDVDGGTLVKETFSVNGDAQLICSSFVNGGVVGTSVLIAGVDGFQVQYGLAATADDASVNRYVNAAAASAQLQGFVNQRIRSIRFAILVRSDEKEAAAGVSSDNFQLLDTQVSSKQASIINSSYRVYETTVAIFNADKGRLP